MTDDVVHGASGATTSEAGDGGTMAVAGAPYRQQLPNIASVKMAKQQLYQNGGSGARHDQEQTPAASMHGGRDRTLERSTGRPTFSVRHQHMIRLIGQFLSRCGLGNTVDNLMRESGLHIEEDIACRLRQSIMSGKWQEAEKHLLMLKPFIIVTGHQPAAITYDSARTAQANSGGGRVSPTNVMPSMQSDDAGARRGRDNEEPFSKVVQQETLLKKMYFLVRERKFLELLEATQILDALMVLRNEIGTLNVNVERMHELAMFLMMPITTPSAALESAAKTTANGTTSNGFKPRASRHARYRAVTANDSSKGSSMKNGNSTAADGASLTSADGVSISASDTNDETDETEVDGVMLDGKENGGGDASRFYRRNKQHVGVEALPIKCLEAREALVNALQAFLPPGIMLPPDRLEVLIDQAVAYQMQRCTLHDCAFMAHDDDSNDTDNVRSNIVTNNSKHAGSRSCMLRRPGIRRSIMANGYNTDQIQNGSVPVGSHDNHHYQALPHSAAAQEDDAITSVDDEESDDDDLGGAGDAGSRSVRNESPLRQPQFRSRFNRSYGLLTDHVCDEADFPAACIQTLKDHSDEVWFVRFSHNGKYLASASRDGRVLIYAIDLHETLMARRLYTFDVARDSNTAVSAVAFLAWSPDDRFLAACGQESNGSSVLIWNMEHGTLHSRINRTAEDALTCVAWRKCSRRLVMGGMRGQFYYSDLDGTSLGAWDGIRVQALAYGGVGLGRFFQRPRRSDDNSGAADGAVAPAAVATEEPPLPADPGYGMGHSESGNDTVVATDAGSSGRIADNSDTVGVSDCYVLAADTHYRVRVYNFDAVPRPLDAGLIQEDHPIISFTCNASGRWALLNVQDQSLRIWDLYDRSLVRKYRGVQESKFTVHSCFGGSREQFIVSGSEDRHVYIWHIDNSEPVQVLRGHTGCVGCVHWNKAQPMLIASASDDKTVRLWAPRRYVNEGAAAAVQQSGDEPMLADESLMPSNSSDNVSRAQSGDAGSTLPPPPPSAAASGGSGSGSGAGSRFSISNPYSGGSGGGGSRSIGHLFRRGLLGSHAGGSGGAGSSDLPLLFMPNDSMSAGSNAAIGAADAAALGYAGGVSGANMPYADSGAAALVAAGFSGRGGGGGSEQHQSGGGDASGAFPDLRTPSSMFHRVITPTLAAASTRRTNAALVRDLGALNAGASGSSSGTGRGSSQNQDDYHLYPGGSTSGSGRGSGSSTVPFQSSASRLLQMAFQQHEAASSHSSRQQQLQQQQQLLQEQSAAWAASLMPSEESGNNSGSESGPPLMATLQNLVAQRNADAALRRLAPGTTGQSSSSSSAMPFSQRYQQFLAAAATSGSNESVSALQPSIRFREAFGGERFGTDSAASGSTTSNEAVSAALANILGSVESAAATGGSSGSSTTTASSALPSFAQRYAGLLQSPAHNDSSGGGGNLRGGALNFSLLNTSSLSTDSAALVLDDEEDESHGPTNISTSALFGHAASAGAVATANAAGDDDDDDDTDDDGDNDADAMHDVGAHLMNFFGVANLDYEDDGDSDDDDDDDDNEEDEDEAGQPGNNNDGSNASGGSAQPTTPTAPPPAASSASRRGVGRGVGGSSNSGASQQHRDDRARR